jgi:hypothetical protein
MIKNSFAILKSFGHSGFDRIAHHWQAKQTVVLHHYTRDDLNPVILQIQEQALVFANRLCFSEYGLRRRF